MSRCRIFLPFADAYACSDGVSASLTLSLRNASQLCISSNTCDRVTPQPALRTSESKGPGSLQGVFGSPRSN